MTISPQKTQIRLRILVITTLHFYFLVHFNIRITLKTNTKPYQMFTVRLLHLQMMVALFPVKLICLFFRTPGFSVKARIQPLPLAPHSFPKYSYQRQPIYKASWFYSSASTKQTQNDSKCEIFSHIHNLN